jgi:hypothetical protein
MVIKYPKMIFPVNSKLTNVIFSGIIFFETSVNEFITLFFYELKNMIKFMFKHDVSLLTGHERIRILYCEQKQRINSQKSIASI